MVRFPLLTALLASPITLVLGVREYIILNQCPSAITLYINGESQGSLAANGGSTTRELIDNWSGFIYTDANGGNQNGTGTTRAGFYGQASALRA